MAYLELPTVKVFSKHLREVAQASSNSWKIQTENGSVNVKLVWIQGFVVQVRTSYLKQLAIMSYFAILSAHAILQSLIYHRCKKKIILSCQTSSDVAEWSSVRK